MTENILKGDWVEISRVVLEPNERAQNLPEDTARIPYSMKIRGTALQDGKTGEEMKIKTVGGREVSGKAEAVNPFYDHDFGVCVPELVKTRQAIKKIRKGGGR